MSLIECDSLVKIYGQGSGAVSALRGVTFKVEQGENIAIIGPSGSGKSTLLQILGCLDLPTNGTYRLGGTNVLDLNDDKLSELRGEKIGFVFQSFHLFPRLSLLDNVALPLMYQGVNLVERRERAAVALGRVKMSHRETHMPHQLSGGERQRGAIARAIVHQPALILADEPTGNLDSTVKYEILEHLQKLNEENNTTIIVVTHDSETAKWAKRVVSFSDGNIKGIVDAEE